MVSAENTRIKDSLKWKKFYLYILYICVCIIRTLALPMLKVKWQFVLRDVYQLACRVYVDLSHA